MFQFEKDQSELKALFVQLENIGLVLVERTEEYQSRSWVLETRWESGDEYRIIWLQEWVNDGCEKEDVRVELKLNGLLIESIKFEQLSVSDGETSLRGSIRNRIIESLGKLTGKNT